jgi:hypothetical protein
LGVITQNLRPKKWEWVITNHVAILVKAINISIDFEHIYKEAKILTDIRPIYATPRAQIVAAMVCHRLQLSYSDANTVKMTVSIAMDRKDVEQLRSACEEALKKANVATELITKKAELELFRGAEEANELFREI